MKINVYEGKVWGKDGNVSALGEVRAFNRADAANSLGCFKEDVNLVRAHVPLLKEEVMSRIYIAHHPAHIDKAVAHVDRSMGGYKSSSSKKRKKRKS